MSGRAILGRLPELDRISIGVLQAGEAAVGVRLLVNLEHPHLLLAAEVIGIGREGLEHRRAGFPAPGLLVVARRREVDAEVVAVPRLERARVARAEEEAADARHSFHLHLPCSLALKPRCRTRARRAGALRTRCPNPPRAPSGSARSARSPPPSTSPRGPRSRRSLPSSP